MNSVAKKVRQKIDRGGTRLWRIEDFRPLPARAVARELSRLAGSGYLQRVRKGLYRRGKGQASQQELLGVFPFPLHPARASAAHVLGLAPKPKRAAYATTARVRPGDLSGQVLLRRPPLRKGLSPEEGAALEFIRDRGAYSKESPAVVMKRLRRVAGDRWSEFLPVVLQEPPRVRAIWGALGEDWGASEKDLWRLRRTLNPLSTFRAGIFSHLRGASGWQLR